MKSLLERAEEREESEESGASNHITLHSVPSYCLPSLQNIIQPSKIQADVLTSTTKWFVGVKVIIFCLSQDCQIIVKLSVDLSEDPGCSII